jgi:hypothetical protein
LIESDDGHVSPLNIYMAEDGLRGRFTGAMPPHAVLEKVNNRDEQSFIAKEH